MQYLIVVTLLAFFAFSCSDSTDNKEKNNKVSVPDISKISDDTVNYTNIQWLDSVQNLGVLEFGQKVQIKYRFQNSGPKPLYIISVIPGCGCTVADYPKEPITAGKEGVIVAEFDTNRVGAGGFKKNIIITSNTKPSARHVLYFSGEVKKNEGENNNKM